MPGLTEQEKQAGLIMTDFANALTFALKTPSVKANVAFMKDLASASASANQQYQQISDSIKAIKSAIGPSQVELFDTARGNLYKTYGGNTAAAVLGATAVAPTLAPSPPLAAQPTHANGQPAAAPAATTHVSVTNHYKTQPQDPHAWSQGLAWELGAAL